MPMARRKSRFSEARAEQIRLNKRTVISRARTKSNNNNRNKRKSDGNDGVSGAELVVVANQNKGKVNPKKEWTPLKKAKTDDNILDKSCHIHITKDEKGNIVYPKHTTRQCRVLKRMVSGK